MKQKIIYILMLVLIIAAFYERGYFSSNVDKGFDSNNQLEYAYKNRKSNLQVEGSGVVDKVLRDDTEGSRHQRFIVRISGEQTLLIAHNIDLAPRVVNIKKGDNVEFFGEYEWNNKGGVIHWTHRDPQRKHVDGWIRHQSKMYQ